MEFQLYRQMAGASGLLMLFQAALSPHPTPGGQSGKIAHMCVKWEGYLQRAHQEHFIFHMCLGPPLENSYRSPIWDLLRRWAKGEGGREWEKQMREREKERWRSVRETDREKERVIETRRGVGGRGVCESWFHKTRFSPQVRRCCGTLWHRWGEWNAPTEEWPSPRLSLHFTVEINPSSRAPEVQVQWRSPSPVAPLSET